ncbi:MAG: hypothetical protein JNM99_12155 [Verrucomicrobiaceae bacterium]|nr:hypothetical protein [Verrucomicrobiaceae bacterium]
MPQPAPAVRFTPLRQSTSNRRFTTSHPFNDAIFDCSHNLAGSKGKSPIPVLEKYHACITNLHLKDRTADGGNLPRGQGQTPIKEVLQLMKKEKWTLPAEPERR